jgi:hypothetical protein
MRQSKTVEGQTISWNLFFLFTYLFEGPDETNYSTGKNILIPIVFSWYTLDI